MADPYESNFHKIASADALPAGKPVIYRAAGATLVLRKDGDHVEAIDGSCLADDTSMPHTSWRCRRGSSMMPSPNRRGWR